MHITLYIGTLAAAAALSAHAGTAGPFVDTSYGTGGTSHVGFDIGGDKNDLPQAATLLDDGTFVVGGQLDIQNHSGVGDDNYHQLGVARFNPDGTPDATFGTGGKVELTIAPPNGNAGFADVRVTGDGHILIVATYSNLLNTYNGNIVVERLNTNGALDTSFNFVGYRIFTPASLIAGGTPIGGGHQGNPARGREIARLRRHPDGDGGLRVRHSP
jgi:uncharacterized delta-60 repeat protein